MSAGRPQGRRSATSTPPSPGRSSSSTASTSAGLPAPRGTVWRNTAADVASGFAWAELHATERNPRARFGRALVHRIARELKAAGRRLGAATTDTGSEFRAREFTDAVEVLGASHRREVPRGAARRRQLGGPARQVAGGDPQGGSGTAAAPYRRWRLAGSLAPGAQSVDVERMRTDPTQDGHRANSKSRAPQTHVSRSMGWWCRRCEPKSRGSHGPQRRRFPRPCPVITGRTCSITPAVGEGSGE